MNPILLTIIQKIAGKLLERSSVAAYLVGILGAFGVKDNDLAGHIAGVLTSFASIVLFILNDATLGAWIRGKAISPQADVVEPKPITVPESLPTTAAEAAPEEVTPMSLISSVTSVLAKVQAIANLLPLLTALVQTVEAALPAGTPGAAKLKAVEDALAAVYAKEQTTSVAFSEIWPALSGIASSLVATFKATGAFSSSTPAAAPAPVTVQAAA